MEMEITAEQMDSLRAAAEQINNIFEELKEILSELCKKIVDVLTPYIRKAMEWAKEWAKEWQRYCLRVHAKAAGLEKCYHLAFFARKRRTRKKNLKRLLKSMEDDDL